jgi:hypothetical protein
LQAIANIRTVQGLGCEAEYVRRFVALLDTSHRRATRRNHEKEIFLFSHVTKPLSVTLRPNSWT